MADPLDPNDPRDVDAARRVDAQMNRLFLDPVVRGTYPADLLDDVRGLGLERHVRPGDLDVIASPIDVLGVNYYNGEAIGHEPASAPSPTTSTADGASARRSPRRPRRSGIRAGCR